MFQTPALLIRVIKFIELNLLCKHIEKIRNSQAAILCIEFSETQLFPVSIVITITRDVTTVTYHSDFILKGKGSNYTFKNLRQGLSTRNFDPKMWFPKILNRSSVIYLIYACSKSI